ncbi:hypothetical protein [Spirosoma areae]
MSEPPTGLLSKVPTNIKLPGIGRSIGNVLTFLILISVLTAGCTILWKPLGYLVPWLFVGRVYRPLFSEYTYGWKLQGVYKRDIWAKYGQRYLKNQLVVDKANKIYYTPQQRAIARIEGTIKAVIFGVAIMLVAMSKEKVKTVPKAPLTIKNLTIGSSVSTLKQQENDKLQAIGDSWFYVDNTVYAQERGNLDYHVEQGVIEAIKFTPADATAYPRLATLLYAKYGAAQDTSGQTLTWATDSVRLELSKPPFLKLQLHKAGLFR